MIVRPRAPEVLLQPNGVPFSAKSAEIVKVDDLTHIDDVKRVARETEASAAALISLVLSDAFQEAAAPKGHTKSFETLIILPGDPQHEILREAARRTEHAIFGPKDGEDRAGLDHHYGSHEAGTVFVLPLDHQRRFTMPMSMMRGDRPAGKGLVSVDDGAGPPWKQDPEQLMADTKIPRPDVYRADPDNPLHFMSLPDLRIHPHVMDIVTIGILPAYRKQSSTPGVRPALMMYNALCRGLTAPADIEFWATILDTPALRSIQAGFGAPFRHYAQEELLPEERRRLKRLPYYAVRDPVTGRYSNNSCLYFSDVITWYKKVKQTMPQEYALLFGDVLDKEVQLTVLGDMRAFRGEAPSERWDYTRRALGEISLDREQPRSAPRENIYISSPHHRKLPDRPKRHFVTEAERQVMVAYLSRQIKEHFEGDEQRAASYSYGETRCDCVAGFSHLEDGEPAAVQLVRKRLIGDKGHESFEYQANIITRDSTGDYQIAMLEESHIPEAPIGEVMMFTLAIHHAGFDLESSQEMASIMQETDPQAVDWRSAALTRRLVQNAG